MEQRKCPRKAPSAGLDNNVTYQTVHEQPGITGEGSLIDISEEGCRIGGAHRVWKGLYLQMAVTSQSGRQTSTVLTHCQVIWARDEEFGVHFLWEGLPQRKPQHKTVKQAA